MNPELNSPKPTHDPAIIKPLFKRLKLASWEIERVSFQLESLGLYAARSRLKAALVDIEAAKRCFEHAPFDDIPKLTAKEARQKRMEPLTHWLAVTDPTLWKIVEDMERVPGTEWAFVDAKLKLGPTAQPAVEVWRVPSRTLIKDASLNRDAILHD